MQEGGNYMTRFNRDLVNPGLLAIKRLIERVEKDDKQQREIKRNQLLSTFATTNIDSDYIRNILEYFNIDIISGKLPSIKELSVMLIPDVEDDGVTYKVTQLKDTFVPTDEKSTKIVPNPEGTPFKEADTIERVGMLINFLKENDIEVKSYHILKGQNAPEMMRKESYVLCIIPSLDSMVLVCNEEGNVSFVIRDLPVDPKQYYKLTKDQLKDHPKIAPHIRWSDQKTWETQILDMLTDPRTSFDKTRSDRVEKITLDQLRVAVKEAGINSAREYFKIRTEDHLEWPLHPERCYQGWESWLDLFDKEKIEYLTLEKLKVAVKEAGINSEGEYKKYKEENMLKEWPSNPDKYYDIWESWPDLFGREKPNFLTLNELKLAVKEAGVNSQTKYHETRKKHPNWPSQPYTLEGWKSWLDLLNKAELVKTLEELKIAVREARVSSIEEYKMVRKKDHPEWPSHPDGKYLGKGWKSWSDLFGR